jgi:aspartate ammonia-lyase
MSSRKGQPRIETDEHGEVTIPAGSYWGSGTSRALEFFAATGRQSHPALVEAIVQIKKAVALTNGELGLINRQTVSAITQVCDEILSGQWRDQIVVDAIHGGAGVGLIINVNELIANRASEILGDALESLTSVNASKHVNLSQSTNDVYTTAMRIALLTSTRKLQTTVLEMERLLRRKSLEFERVVKVGRTGLRDDAPITLGQEFNCFGSTIERGLRRIKDASASLEEISLGGRSVGTGFNTAPEFNLAVVRQLSQITGFPLRAADDYFRLTQSMSDFVAVSSSLRELAVDLAKIAADLRLMGSGPTAGFGEIKLPELIMQPSNLWPDVMPKTGIPPLTESLIMVCYQVIGNDHAVCLAAQAGQLESNTLTPLIIDNMLVSITMLHQVLDHFNHHCLIKVTADTIKCKQTLDKSGALIAALTTEVGYQKALDIVSEAKNQGVDVREYLQSATILPRAALDKILHYKFLTTPHLMVPGSPHENSGDDTR